ncbi:TrmH family RNA methyltransferase [Microbacterium sp. NPDC077391]|uniref:TrmH family RNA methyltransferase n=1 Tax=Microbacterium sp. NPDC077391 TaxID=3154765 RepID=UPI003414C60D
MRNKRNTFGIGIFNPKKEVNLGTLTRSAFIMGADFVFTIGGSESAYLGSDTTQSKRHMPFLRFASFEEARRVLWQYNFVAVEQGGQSLATFTHPKQAAYLLGSEVEGLPADAMEGSDAVVQIETFRPFSLNVAQTGGIVLYDRIAKFSR